MKKNDIINQVLIPSRREEIKNSSHVSEEVLTQIGCKDSESKYLKIFETDC